MATKQIIFCPECREEFIDNKLKILPAINFINNVVKCRKCKANWSYEVYVSLVIKVYEQRLQEFRNEIMTLRKTLEKTKCDLNKLGGKVKNGIK